MTTGELENLADRVLQAQSLEICWSSGAVAAGQFFSESLETRSSPVSSIVGHLAEDPWHHSAVTPSHVTRCR
jgi:hypothetical protein